MGQTITEKIAQAHMAEGPKRALRAGDFVSLRPKHVMTHDNTSAVIKKFKAIGAKKTFDPRQPVFALDHDIQNRDDANLKKYAAIEAFAREHGIDFYPAGTGIGHQIMCERGYVTPGSLVVASDSHSNMYGALGALGTPVVRTDAAAIWATGEFWWQIPRTMQVVLEGRLAPGVSGKDVIIALCGICNDEVLNAVVEFSGLGVASLSMDARMAIANMSTEWGVLAAWFPVDEVTLAWLRARREERIALGEPERYSEGDLRSWRANPPASDADANYAGRITFDLSILDQKICGPDTTQETRSLALAEREKIAIQKAYLVSCVNSRLEDLEAAAQVLKGRNVAARVKFYLGAASQRVQQEAERRGVWQTLANSGATMLPAGCGPCIGLGVGLLEPGETGISATNRNFKGRMGSREAQCYLGSPAVVAASAVAGYICSPQSLDRGELSGNASSPRGGMNYSYQRLSARGASTQGEAVEILRGFPERVRGRLVFLPKDNLNTDGIYAGAYTYREDMEPEMMARVVFDNYDPELTKQLRAGDVIVGGLNFGTGSSREQAVTALKARGIPLVIAASFSQTYLRNAFNNGFLCIEQAELVGRLRDLWGGGPAARPSGSETRSHTVSSVLSWIPGDELVVDFAASHITWGCDEFHFPPLGTVPQSLVIAGGIEELVRRRLAKNC